MNLSESDPFCNNIETDLILSAEPRVSNEKNESSKIFWFGCLAPKREHQKEFSAKKLITQFMMLYN